MRNPTFFHSKKGQGTKEKRQKNTGLKYLPLNHYPVANEQLQGQQAGFLNKDHHADLWPVGRLICTDAFPASFLARCSFNAKDARCQSTFTWPRGMRVCKRWYSFLPYLCVWWTKDSSSLRDWHGVRDTRKGNRGAKCLRVWHGKNKKYKSQESEQWINLRSALIQRWTAVYLVKCVCL